jgi:glycosyltransferase involved in cell wall biosynthesis
VRVLIMAHTWVPVTGAGAETCTHAFARALVAAGHTVDVCLTEAAPVKSSYVVDGVSVWHTQNKATPFRWFGTADNSPDVVITYLHSTVRAAALCLSYGIPLVQICHNEQAWTVNNVARGAALVIYNTEWVRDSIERELVRTGRQLPVRTEVIHPPIDRDAYAGEPGTDVTLVNLADVKGADVFWEMARRFPEQRFLGVCGGYSDQLIMDLPNSDVIPHQAPADMSAVVYARTKVLLMPSRYESYGMVGVEASCRGIPVLASPRGGLVEALGDAGTFVELDDLDGWERALRKLLTPRGWSAASKRAAAVTAALTTDADLDRFVKSVEDVALRPVRSKDVTL